VTPFLGPSARSRPPDHLSIRDATPLNPTPADQRAPAATRAPHAGEPDVLPSQKTTPELRKHAGRAIMKTVELRTNPNPLTASEVAVTP
jgi:hypothetical protein